MCMLPGALKQQQDELDSRPKEATAKQIVDEYFRYMDVNSIHEHLWELTHGTITNELPETQTGADRHNLIFFYEYTKLFFSAAWFLYNKEKKG